MPGMSRSRRRYSRDDGTPLISAVLVLKEDAKKGWTRFHEAIEHQPDLDETDSDGFTALMYAVRLDLPTAIPALVKAGATVDLRDQDGNTPFHYASMFRQWLVMSVLLKLGAQIDALDQNGYTALLSAVDAQDEELVDVLLKMGANPNERGRGGISAVVLALSHKTLPCKPSILRRLLEAGADPNLHDVTSGATALMRACDPNRPCVEAVKLLLGHGADLGLTAKNGRTAVHECLRSLSSLPCLALLLEAGADPNVLDNQGFTPLSMLGHHVNKLGSNLDHKFLATLSLLLHHGADPNVLGLRASPNFIMASAVGKSCSYQALRMLLASGIEPVPAQESSRIPRPSPLAFAFDLGKTDVARLLTDGLVFTSRDTVHITKYCTQPANFHHYQQQQQQQTLREHDPARYVGDGCGGRSSPSSSLGSKGRVSSSGSLLNSSSGSSPSNTPRSSISGQFSGQFFPQNPAQPTTKHSPPRRCNSNTQTSSVTEANKSNGHFPVHTSCSSPSLSMSARSCETHQNSKTKTKGGGGGAPCHNMVFPDKHNGCDQLTNGHSTSASSSKSNVSDTGSTHQHNGGSKMAAYCNGASASLRSMGNSCGVLTPEVTHTNGRTSKQRSSSNSRHGSHSSLNISRRPSLTEVFSFNGRNSSPGPSSHSNNSSNGCGPGVMTPAVEAELHELALQVCHTVPTLQQQCRRSIHRALCSPRDRQRCVEQLPVSGRLQRYILFQGPEYNPHN